MSSIDLEIATEVVNKLDETLENFQSHAVSILSLSENWQEVESSFAMAEASMAAREKNLELNQKVVIEIERRAEELLSEMRFRNDKLNLMEKKLIDRGKELDLRETLLESWEMEFDTKTEVLMAKEKEIDERFRVLESKEVEFRKRGEMVESKEKKMVEIDERFRVLESKEVEFRKRGEMVESREKEIEEIDERFRVLESKEKEIEESFRVKNDVDERLRVLESREVEIREKEIELKRVQQLFENRVSRRKKVQQLCRVMEVTQAGIVEKWEALKMPVLEGFEMVEMEIEQGLNDLELDNVIL